MRTKTLICLCVAALMLSFSSCGRSDGAIKNVSSLQEEPQAAVVGEMNQPTDSTESILFPKYHDIENSEIEEIQNQCKEIALLCNDLMVNGEKENQPYSPYETTLTQSAIDGVEALLSEAGYPVLNSDSKYPVYLENSNGLRQFIEMAKKGENARHRIVSVSSHNSVSCLTFQYEDGTMYYINAAITWNEEGKFTLSDPYKTEMLDWGMTYNGYFYYQVYPLDRHWDACMSIRLEPINIELYDLYAEYLAPVGYPSSVFTLDWDKSNHEVICFNDLFEALYRERYKDHVYPDHYEYDSNMQCSLIPAEIFEDSILPYFEIPLDEFRASTLYMRESNTYPWQTLNGSNIIYCPTLTPDVVERRENEDGTFTIVVDVLCFDYKCFPMFTHEITIRPDGEGGFHYIANRITYESEQGVPATTPRLKAQRK